MIKRTEITIETVEITTVRRTRRGADEAEPFQSDMAAPLLTSATTPDTLETIRENEIEEHKENENAK